MGGVERTGKGSHRIVKISGKTLSIPHGILKQGLLRKLIHTVGLDEDAFIRYL